MSQSFQSPSAAANQPEEVHLQDYINVILRRRKLFVAVFFAVFLGVALYTFTMKPVYQATATLHLKDDKAKGGLLGELALNTVNPIDAELEILKSRSNAENVVKRLHLDWQVSKRTDGLRFRVLEFSSTGQKPSYTITLTAADTYTVSNDGGKTVGSGSSGQLLQGQGFTLLLHELRGKAGDSFRLDLLPFNETVKALRNGLKAVEVGKKTNIISLSYASTEPDKARDVVNTLVQVYLDQTIAFKTEEASRTVGFVEEQLKGVRTELEGAEKNLQAYKTTSGVVQLDAEAQSLILAFADADKRKAEIGLQKKQMEFALASLKDARKRGATYSPAVMRDDPLVAEMAAKLAELEVQKRALMADNTESHPAVKALQAQIDELQKKIQSTYETSQRNLARQEGTVSQQLGRYEGQLKTLPAAERDLARLTRLSKVNADIYTFLLQKHEEARIAKASTISNINVVDPAISPDTPVKPQKKKNLLLGLLVGLMLGVGLAFFQEYLDDTIKDAEEAKRLLALPLLAVIPKIHRKEKGSLEPDFLPVCHLEPQSIAAEAFRSLRTSIHFASLNREKKLILFTSTFPGEGKSTIAANYATILTQTGSRVLLIDCDLRRATLHTKFGQSKVPGLSEILAGDAEVAKCIHTTGITGLSVVSAGITPPNPAELLGSASMAGFLEEQRHNFDYIIIDAPPMLAVTDALVLTTLCDIVIVILESGRVPRKAAVRIREILTSAQSHVGGFILNDKAGNSERYGYYGSGYGYGQGYYSDESDKEKSARKWWRVFNR
jgi:tyrosine-protein kinase Etk/Wzc